MRHLYSGKTTKILQVWEEIGQFEDKNTAEVTYIQRLYKWKYIIAKIRIRCRFQYELPLQIIKLIQFTDSNSANQNQQ